MREEFRQQQRLRRIGTALVVIVVFGAIGAVVWSAAAIVRIAGGYP